MIPDNSSFNIFICTASLTCLTHVITAMLLVQLLGCSLALSRFYRFYFPLTNGSHLVILIDHLCLLIRLCPDHDSICVKTAPGLASRRSMCHDRRPLSVKSRELRAGVKQSIRLLNIVHSRRRRVIPSLWSTLHLVKQNFLVREGGYFKLGSGVYGFFFFLQQKTQCSHHV